jgi:nicotinamidase/pyrazinamidase
MRTVFFDVDTQLDFLYPAGALYVPGAESLEYRIEDLNRLAATRGIVVVSTMDAHSENDIEFRQWPPHCVVGTAGQHKPAATLLDRRLTLPSTPAQFDIADVQQILLEKQTTDCFSNPNLPALLERLEADRAIVYGVVTEVCVKNAALGLLRAGKQVWVVTDAVECLNKTNAEAFLEDFVRQGGALVEVAQVPSIV